MLLIGCCGIIMKFILRVLKTDGIPHFIDYFFIGITEIHS
jgi:hypothetical protein